MISTVGVALAMVRDTVERNIVEPTPDDILAVRREATDAAIRAGALPETIEVQVEVDTRRNLVRATAFGTTEMKRGEEAARAFDLEDCRAAAARSMRLPTNEVGLAATTGALHAFTAERREPRCSAFSARRGRWRASRTGRGGAPAKERC